MTAAFGWGFLASLSLLAGGIVALRARVGSQVIGIVMAFGAGVLISAVAYELVDESFAAAAGLDAIAFGLTAGALVFFAGDLVIDRMGGEGRKSAGGGQQAGTPLAIVLGIVLDGIPESAVIGVSLLEGGHVSVPVIAAVAISNMPEAIAATTGLTAAGWKPRTTLALWLLVAVVSGLAAFAGYALLGDASPATLAFVLAFAAGAILTMLADTMMPEAFERGGKVVGLATTLGFAVAFAISSFE